MFIIWKHQFGNLDRIIHTIGRNGKGRHCASWALMQIQINLQPPSALATTTCSLRHNSNGKLLSGNSLTFHTCTLASSCSHTMLFVLLSTCWSAFFFLLECVWICVFIQFFVRWVWCSYQGWHRFPWFILYGYHCILDHYAFAVSIYDCRGLTVSLKLFITYFHTARAYSHTQNRVRGSTHPHASYD